MTQIKDKEGISPIVGTILLIGICVVLASAMFVWVSGLKFQSGFVPTAELAIVSIDLTDGKTNYTILIKVLRPKTEPKDIKCYICDKDGFSKASAAFPPSPGSKVTFSDAITGNITWSYDNGDDARVSSYDVLNLSVDKDVTFLKDYTFVLRHNPTGGSLIGVVKLE